MPSMTEATRKISPTKRPMPDAKPQKQHKAFVLQSNVRTQPVPPTSATVSDKQPYQFDQQGRPVLVFSDHPSAAIHYRRRVTVRPDKDPLTDPTIVQVRNAKEQYISEMVQAVFNLDERVKDRPNSRERYMFDAANRYAVTGYEVEAACRFLFDTIIDRCVNGYRGPYKENKIRQGNYAYKVDRDGDCLSRITNVITALWEWKSAGRDILYEDFKCIQFANAPLYYASTKRSNQRNNNIKQASINKSRKIIAEKEAEKLVEEDAKKEPQEAASEDVTATREDQLQGNEVQYGEALTTDNADLYDLENFNDPSPCSNQYESQNDTGIGNNDGGVLESGDWYAQPQPQKPNSLPVSLEHNSPKADETGLRSDAIEMGQNDFVVKSYEAEGFDQQPPDYNPMYPRVGLANLEPLEHGLCSPSYLKDLQEANLRQMPEVVPGDNMPKYIFYDEAQYNQNHCYGSQPFDAGLVFSPPGVVLKTEDMNTYCVGYHFNDPGLANFTRNMNPAFDFGQGSAVVAPVQRMPNTARTSFKRQRPDESDDEEQAAPPKRRKTSKPEQNDGGDL